MAAGRAAGFGGSARRDEALSGFVSPRSEATPMRSARADRRSPCPLQIVVKRQQVSPRPAPATLHVAVVTGDVEQGEPAHRRQADLEQLGAAGLAHQLWA